MGIILSASRRTDIPAFYFEWFLERVQAGYLEIKNPRNPHQIKTINLSPMPSGGGRGVHCPPFFKGRGRDGVVSEGIDMIVFWTKNAQPVLEKLHLLKDYQYYFLYTITAYDEDIEPFKKDYLANIKTFQMLSEMIGKERVIWRYDPVLLNDRYTIQRHFKRFEFLCQNLSNYTNKVIFSFIDIEYRGAKHLTVQNITSNEIEIITQGLLDLSKQYGLSLETCAENINNITPSHCIDEKLISRLIGKEIIYKKDSGQRKTCSCHKSIDIGVYNTCLNGCKYCYANFKKTSVL